MKEIAVVSALNELLKPLGFKKKKGVWNRSRKVVEVIDIQVSKAGDSATINAGVLDRDVYALLWQKSSPDFVDASFCTVRARIGELIDGLDRWWPLEDLGATSEITRAVENYALPFLQQTQSREAMEDWLAKPEVVRRRFPFDILALAIIRNSLGKKSEARELLSELKKRAVGAWRPRVAAVDEYLQKH